MPTDAIELLHRVENPAIRDVTRSDETHSPDEGFDSHDQPEEDPAPASPSRPHPSPDESGDRSRRHSCRPQRAADDRPAPGSEPALSAAATWRRCGIDTASTRCRCDPAKTPTTPMHQPDFPLSV